MAKSLSCKHCQLSFELLPTAQRANHSRWCQSNPKRAEYVRTNSGAQLNSPAAIEKRSHAIAQAHIDGKYEGAADKIIATKKCNGTLTHTELSKEKMRVSANKSTHQRVCKSTHDYTDKHGRTFKFDSSWEDALADRLDNLDISWTRPEPISYEFNGKTKRYYPDFYLTEHDVYLDPKNSYCEKVQKEKLDLVSTKIELHILRSLRECQEFSWPVRRDSNPH